jgi:hypothetical protein
MSFNRHIYPFCIVAVRQQASTMAPFGHTIRDPRVTLYPHYPDYTLSHRSYRARSHADRSTGFRIFHKTAWSHEGVIRIGTASQTQP